MCYVLLFTVKKKSPPLYRPSKNSDNHHFQHELSIWQKGPPVHRSLCKKRDSCRFMPCKL